MTQAEFRKTLEKLDLSQMALSRLIGAGERTVRQWALGQASVSEPVSLLLMLLDDPTNRARVEKRAAQRAKRRTT